MGGGCFHHMGEGVSLHRLEGVNPAIDQPVMGFAVVMEVIDLDAIAPERNPVEAIGQDRAQGPPTHRAGSQLLQAHVGEQLGDQGEHRWGFGKQGVLENPTAGLEGSQGERHVFVAPEEITDPKTAGVTAGIGLGRQLQDRGELGIHQVAAHLVGTIGQTPGMVVGG